MEESNRVQLVRLPFCPGNLAGRPSHSLLVEVVDLAYGQLKLTYLRLTEDDVNPLKRHVFFCYKKVVNSFLTTIDGARASVVDNLLREPNDDLHNSVIVVYPDRREPGKVCLKIYEDKLKGQIRVRCSEKGVLVLEFEHFYKMRHLEEKKWFRLPKHRRLRCNLYLNEVIDDRRGNNVLFVSRVYDYKDPEGDYDWISYCLIGLDGVPIKYGALRTSPMYLSCPVDQSFALFDHVVITLCQRKDEHAVVDLTREEVRRLDTSWCQLPNCDANYIIRLRAEATYVTFAYELKEKGAFVKTLFI